MVACGAAEIGLDQRVLSPGDTIRTINGDETQADMKRHLMGASILHMLVNRPRVDAVVVPVGVANRAVLCLPPVATPLPNVRILPPPRTSLSGPGSWPSSAQDICELFAEKTNVTIDLDFAFISREIRSEPGRVVWFGLEIRRLCVLGRPLDAAALISLLTGTGSVIDQSVRIARVFHTEFGHWKRNSPNGVTSTIRRPPDDFRSAKRDYAWLLVLPVPGRGLYERLWQAVARAMAAHTGPRGDVYPRFRYHVSFETNRHAPWDAATL